MCGYTLGFCFKAFGWTTKLGDGNGRVSPFFHSRRFLRRLSFPLFSSPGSVYRGRADTAVRMTGPLPAGERASGQGDGWMGGNCRAGVPCGSKLRGEERILPCTRNIPHFPYPNPHRASRRRDIVEFHRRGAARGGKRRFETGCRAGLGLLVAPSLSSVVKAVWSGPPDGGPRSLWDGISPNTKDLSRRER